MGATAQDLPRFFYKYYEGTLGNSPISLHLQHKDGFLTGYYYYKSKGQPLSLNGSVTDGMFRLEESVPTRDEDGLSVTGYWSIEFGYGNQISGSWRAPKSENTLSIILHEKKSPVAFEPMVREFIFRKTSVGNSSNEEVKVWEFPISFSLLIPKTGLQSPQNVQDSLLNYVLDCKDHLAEPEVCINNSAVKLFNEATRDYTLPAVNFEYSQSQKVMYQNNDLLVLEHGGYSFWGGAHGNSYVGYYNFDMNTGEVLSLRKLLTGEQLDKLAAYIQQNAYYPTEVSDVREGLKEFYLTPGGLGLVFNTYLIASYADGIQEFYVKWEDLETVVGPVALLKSYVGR